MSRRINLISKLIWMDLIRRTVFSQRRRTIVQYQPRFPARRRMTTGFLRMSGFPLEMPFTRIFRSCLGICSGG